LKRNENYFRGRPQLRRVIEKAVPEASNRLTALRSGTVDAAEALQFRDLADIQHTSGLKVHQAPGNHWVQVVLNNKLSPFTDVRVRQALNFAVPRDAIKQSVFQGFAHDATGTAPESYAGFVKQGPWPYDLDKARPLLAAAGLANGFESELTYNGDSPSQ